jgi:cell division septum initiation protein DivIVA
VAGASFPTARKGFDPAAVRAFLSQVSQELGRAQHERDRLARDLDEARQQARVSAPEHMDEATVAAKLGEEAARVLSTAHEAAAQIRAKAEDTSSRLLRDAELEAARQRGDAEVEAARRRQEAEDAAEAEVEAAKAEGRAMVAEARELRERIFADLAHRRDLARQQIDTLQIGNRQVMDALRGARLELDAILTGLEAETAEDEDDDDLDSLDLPGQGPGAGGPDTAVFVLGEMDLPAVIVERHLESVPSPPEDEDLEGEDDVLGTEDESDVEDLEDEEFDEDEDEEFDEDDEGADDVEVIEVVEIEVVDDADQITDEVPVAEDAPSGEAPASVDDLFARLRASSSEAVAREVLEADDAVGSPSAGEGADEADETDEVAPGPEAEALAQRQEALTPVRAALARQLKRVLADEQNEVLDRLRQRSASLTADDVLGTAEAHPGTYREAAEDHLWSAAVAGAGALSDVEGEELHAALEARSVLDRSLDTLEAELVTPMRARLVENLEAAGDTTEAATLVRATYRDWKGRIDELAADLVRTAYGRAAYAVVAPGTPMCWVFDPSGPACADAEDNVLAGAVPAGEPFPTGHRYAPAYRGCRCLLVVAPG